MAPEIDKVESLSFLRQILVVWSATNNGVGESVRTSHFVLRIWYFALRTFHLLNHIFRNLSFTQSKIA